MLLSLVLKNLLQSQEHGTCTLVRIKGSFVRAKIFIRFTVRRRYVYRLQPYLSRNTQILESFGYTNKKFEATKISISVTVQILTFRLTKSGSQPRSW